MILNYISEIELENSEKSLQCLYKMLNNIEKERQINPSNDALDILERIVKMKIHELLSYLN